MTLASASAPALLTFADADYLSKEKIKIKKIYIKIFEIVLRYISEII